MKNKSIPNYPLYGESAPWEMPDPMHCELLEERSSIHNWKIKPHRHNELFQFFLATSGGAVIALDDDKRSVTAPFLMSIPALTVHGFQWLDSTRGVVISVFKSEVDAAISDVQVAQSNLNKPIVIEQKAVDKGTIDQSFSDTIHRISHLFHAFHNEYQRNRHARVSSLKSLLALILIEISRSSFTLAADEPRSISSNETLCSALIALIDEHYTEHQNLQFYADKLHVTTSKMNRMTRIILGASPSDLLARKLVIEAKRYLLYTTMSANQISHKLGFKDAAYFARFFKNKTGETAGQFKTRSKV